jgi:hypothetical protein
MLLQNRLDNPNAFIVAGMFCLTTGIIALLLLHPTTDFSRGLVAGLSGGLIGMSIVFNVRGLLLRRNQSS